VGLNVFGILIVAQAMFARTSAVLKNQILVIHRPVGQVLCAWSIQLETPFAGIQNVCMKKVCENF
jgi:hypothetical protein